MVTIEGKVLAEAEASAPIILLLINDSMEYPLIVNYRLMNKPGDFHFFTEPGNYRIFAFQDANQNNVFDSTERVARSSVLNMTAAGSNQWLEIVLGPLANKKILKEIKNIKKNGLLSLNQSRSTIGQIRALDAKLFTQEKIRNGLWQPYAFAYTGSYGLFLLDKYDPNKKIVVFVHGISGSPLQFKSMIENLDSSQFQAMVAFYPSGLPLGIIGKYMNILLEELHVKLKFKKISIVAYSMGGLISREFVNIQSLQEDSLIDSFISISTPWSGHAAVSTGLKVSPVIIPVWRDMAPDSQFLKTLLSRPISSKTNYSLLFGYNGNRKRGAVNNDGVVSIASQLNPRAQQDASFIKGFDEDHISILKSKDVFSTVNFLLQKQLLRQ